MNHTDEEQPDPSLSGWETDATRVWDRVRTAAVGVGTGLVAGMGSFMYVRREIVPSHDLPLAPGPDWYPVLFVALAGAYVYLLTPDSRESIMAGLVGFFVALTTLVAAVVIPVYALYPEGAREFVIFAALHDAIPGLINGLILLYFGGYLTTLLVLGYMDV